MAPAVRCLSSQQAQSQRVLPRQRPRAPFVASSGHQWHDGHVYRWAQVRARERVRCASTTGGAGPEPVQQQTLEKPTPDSGSTSSVDGGAAPAKTRSGGRKRQADTTDAVASFLTRRFGLAGGLAWLGFLAVGTLGEQVKTRLEVAQEEQGTREVQGAPEVALPSGVVYQDLKVGGGSEPIKGYLAVVHYVGKANGEVFEDTRARGKPIVFFYGGRPYTGGLCAGVEQAMASMKAGGRRIIKVPASAGFGEAGTVLQPTNHVADKSGVIPGGAALEYDLELLRVSIPPS